MTTISEASLKGPLLQKVPTRIRGFDAITGGGLPAGRPSLVCGSAGCGKSLFGLEFLLRRAIEDNVPGVLFTFEERAVDIYQNVASLGFDIPALIAGNLIRIDEIHLDAAEIAETGDYDLDGLFVRMAAAVDEIGARHVVIDTVEALFSCFTNHLILRSELNRMFRWLKNRGLTAVVTAERGGASLSRYGIEEYVSDCVVVLDHRVTEEVSTRRLRILKYRGSSHGTSEYPFLIDDRGFSIMPISSADLDHDVSTEFVTSGIAGIDEMLDGKGYYRGSTMLISGTSGTGKTSVAMAAACAASQRGERSIVFAFEESPSQIVRNMESIGLELSSQLDSGALQIDAVRPSIFGLEQHLLQALRKIESFAPDFVVIDPISGFSGPTSAVSQMLIRLIDALKSRGITAVLTYLAASGDQVERTAESISSLADTWVLLKLVEHNGERQRTIGVLKSRGMRHSNQVRRFDITAQGIEVRPPYTRTLDV